jgi:hypothetical protein
VRVTISDSERELIHFCVAQKSLTLFPNPEFPATVKIFGSSMRMRFAPAVVISTSIRRLRLGNRHTMSSLTQFLLSAKEEYLRDPKKYTVVMGNEAGGKAHPLREQP